MAYTAKFRGEEREFSKEEYIEICTELSKAYKVAEGSYKRRIARDLFDLNIRRFKVWKVWDHDGRPDYEQGAFLRFVQALESFDPDKGSFVKWLGFYVQKHLRDLARNHNRDMRIRDNIPDTPDYQDAEAEEMDSLLMRNARASLPPDEWELIEAHILHGRPISDIAADKGVSAPTIRAKIDTSLAKLRASSAPIMPLHAVPSKNIQGTPKNMQGIDPSGATWLPRSVYRALMGYGDRYLTRLTCKTTPKRLCAEYLDPRDVVGKRHQMRIRTLITPEGGFIYPRRITKK